MKVSSFFRLFLLLSCLWLPYDRLFVALMQIVEDYIISTKAYLFQTSSRLQWDLQLVTNLFFFWGGCFCLWPQSLNEMKQMK